MGADWASPVPVSDQQKDALASKLDYAHPCVWCTDEVPEVVNISFDVDAPDYEDAIASGRRVLAETMNHVGLLGHPLSVTASTDDGQLTWRADSDAVE